MVLYKYMLVKLEGCRREGRSKNGEGQDQCVVGDEVLGNVDFPLDSENPTGSYSWFDFFTSCSKI